MNVRRFDLPARAFRLFTITALIGVTGAVLQTAQAAPGAHGDASASTAHGKAMHGPGHMGQMGAMGHAGHTGRMSHSGSGEHTGRMGHMGDMGHMGHMGHTGHTSRMLDRVGASAEQKAQIKTIMDAARNELVPVHGQMKALREQSAALFTQPAVDANAAEALRLQMQTLQGQASKRMLQAMVESSRVLTPEQRTRMADMMSKRRAMAERHRAEAESLAGKPAGAK